MKKLTKLLCAALVWALLLGAAVSCAKQPDSPVQDTPKQEDPQPAPAAAAGLRIAVDSEPAWSAAVQWFASEQGQALFGDADVHDVFFLVDPQDITQQLRLSNYDAAILCPDQQTLQQLGGYESIPLFRDAVIFVHGDIGQPRGDYDLTADAIRQIYAGSGALFWDQEQRQALIPAYGYSDDADVPVWQQLSMLFGITAGAPDIVPVGEYGNPVAAVAYSDRVGAPLFPCYYQDLHGDAGLNGSVISVDGVLPTDETLEDGTYPFTLSYYGMYSASPPAAKKLLPEIFRGIQASSAR